MSKIENVMSDLGQPARRLQDNELDAVMGGVIGGCIRLPSIVVFPKPPQPTPPWFGDLWEQVGRTGHLPA
jgi:hypothetical protein